MAAVEEVSEERRRRRGDTPYRRWQREEGIPAVQGSYVEDLYSVEVGPWARIGQSGAFINLADQQLDDGWIIEIAAGGRTEPLHHNFEMGILILEGRGATSFWQPGGHKQTVEWQRGSLFAPPLNCTYQHFNLDGQRPARIFAVTNAPTILNLYRSSDYVFNDPYAFTDRYNGESDYFVDHGHPGESRAWSTNFVPDLRTFRLDQYREKERRGAGSSGMSFSLSNNSMAAGTSLFPVGSYKKGHRHGTGAHVMILEGKGYSLLWFEGEEPRKVEWKDGTLISPRFLEYHQHFNTGATPALYFKFRLGSLDPTYGEWVRFTATGDHETEEAGIPYDREDPRIYERFVEECAKNDAVVTLPRPNYIN
jgi:hypothetical protein